MTFITLTSNKTSEPMLLCVGDIVAVTREPDHTQVTMRRGDYVKVKESVYEIAQLLKE